MISLDNVRKTDKETRLFINGSDVKIARWLMEKAGATDYCVYSGLMVLRGKAKKLGHMSKAEIQNEIDIMYKDETQEIRDGVKSIPGVIISNYDANDLYSVLRNSVTITVDPDYREKVRIENSKIDEEIRLNPDTDFGESIPIKNSRLGLK